MGFNIGMNPESKIKKTKTPALNTAFPHKIYNIFSFSNRRKNESEIDRISFTLKVVKPNCSTVQKMENT